jgi:iron complex outermembrane receptor protein
MKRGPLRGSVWIPCTLAAAFLPAGAANAEEPDAARGGVSTIEEVTVTTPRVEKSLLETPAAVGVLGSEDLQRARQQLSLGESLSAIPGVFIQNRYNFAQDVRIAIRGFGARSNFGIRGIKLVVDGIPATLPDGQGQVDSIDLASVERIEVLRGPAASLYGSAAGGVIRIVSEEGPEVPFVRGRAAFGSYGYQGYNAKLGGRARSLDYFGSVSGQLLDGYRDHSRVESLIGNAKTRWTLDDRSDLTLVMSGLHSPEAQDPGGLQAEEVAEDRRQAREENVTFNAGESVDQASGGLVYRRAFGAKHETSLRGFGVWRDFQNKLAFQPGGSVDLDRLFAGGGVEHRYQDEWFGRSNRLLLGFEADAQRDQRIRRNNDEGTIGAETFDQDEGVTSLRFFLQDEFALRDDVELTLALGYDHLEYVVEDHFLTDASGDDSGTTDFGEWSPMFGLHWRALPALDLYGRISTSFEPPTTTELANPSGGGGFNRDLEPQRAVNYEVGAKGLLPGQLRWDLAVFHIRIRDELVPFELPGMPGRSFFTNAGRSSRTGVELGLAYQPFEDLTASLSYTWSHFEFDRFRSDDDIVFDGNRIPGVPEHQLYAQLAYEHRWGFFGVWDLLFVGDVYANNANTVKTDAYAVSNPFVAINNLFDEHYIDNLRINAGDDRYFEPAPERNAYGGISLAYHFGGS